MKALNQKKTKMQKLNSKSFLLIFRYLFLILILSACDNRPEGILNQSKMTEVLIDLHKLDANLYEIGLQYGHYPDKVPYYQNILKKHGITEAKFDSSLVWYTKNPKKFDKIYDNVIASLTEQENDVKRGKYHFVDSVELAKVKDNIWNKKFQYTFSKDSTRTQLDFKISNSSFMYGDVYILHFIQRIAPEDSCKKQHIVLQINYNNGKVDFATVEAHNDSLLRSYNIQLHAQKKLIIKSISGKLLGSKKYKGKFNAYVDSISLMRKYNPTWQDSLRNVVEKANPTKPIKHLKSENRRRAILFKKS